MKTVTLQVVPRELLQRRDLLRDPRRLSWYLLRQAEDLLEEEQDGDAAERNLALAVFEQALDWRIGLAVLGVLQVALRRRRPPKTFALEISRNGSIAVVLPSGRRVEA
jgi:hypothetical protein